MSRRENEETIESGMGGSKVSGNSVPLSPASQFASGEWLTDQVDCRDVKCGLPRLHRGITYEGRSLVVTVFTRHLTIKTTWSEVIAFPGRC